MIKIEMRTRRASDEAFLRRLYADVRTKELGAFPWNAAQKATFLASQYRAREQDRQARYPDADDQIILIDGTPVGRLLVWRTDGAIGLLDIGLLIGYRNQGLGSALIRSLLAEGQRVWLHVALDNSRARRLYERLGFRAVEQTGFYIAMECVPQPKKAHPVKECP